jgi:hypothetical protein
MLTICLPMAHFTYILTLNDVRLLWLLDIWFVDCGDIQKVETF